MSIIDQVPTIVQSVSAVASLIVGVLTYKLIKKDSDEE
jgi:hypothetical protein